MSESTELQQAAPCGAEKKSRSEGFHLEPLDGLRFFAAFWVLLHHGRKPIGQSVMPSFHYWWDGTFFGAAAVFAFFIISGICIHYPTVVARPPSPKWGSFVLRRYVRVLIPYWVILPLATLAGRHYSIFQGGDIAWTLYCELAYYLLYPFLEFLARKTSWIKLLLVSSVVSFGLLFLKQTPSVWGAFLNIFICLPCWLLGCVVAERFVKWRATEDRRIPEANFVYKMRAVIFFAQAGLAYITMSGILYYRYLTVPFCVLLAFWIWTEMRYYDNKAPSRIFAWAGSWSYSMYLVHQVVNGASVPLFYKLPSLPVSAVFVVNTLLIVVCSYLFALCIEWPSQRLARAIARRVKF